MKIKIFIMVFLFSSCSIFGIREVPGKNRAEKLHNIIVYELEHKRWAVAATHIDELVLVNPKDPMLCEWIDQNIQWYEKNDFEKLITNAKVSKEKYCRNK